MSRCWLILTGLTTILAGATPSQILKHRDFTAADIASGEALKTAAAQAYENTWNALPETGDCSKQNVQIRTEFRDLSLPERKAYSDALVCLQNLPSALDSSIYPGSKTRYDDFVVAHINMTGFIHASAQFLTWHRYYLWTMHNTLTEYCGYTGPLPFWEWGFDAASTKPLRESELFNGDPYSMGSDGIYLPNNTDKVFNLTSILGPIPQAINIFPAGSGGGPTFAGPFSNYTTNLGPVASPYLPPLANPFGYNPRPFTRSLRQETLQKYVSYSSYTPFVVNSSTAFEFQTLLDGDGRNVNVTTNRVLWGPHGSGHTVMGGDVGDDLGTSPSEPMFWMHHSQIDRLYWIWQNLDLSQIEYRASTIPNLTRTTYNVPPSDLATIDDLLDINFLGPLIPIKDVLRTTAGLFCYLYK